MCYLIYMFRQTVTEFQAGLAIYPDSSTGRMFAFYAMLTSSVRELNAGVLYCFWRKKNVYAMPTPDNIINCCILSPINLKC